jgi:hypothetical protein
LGIHLEALAIREQTGVVRSFQTNELRLLLPPISTTLLRDFHIEELTLRHPLLVLAFPEEEASGIKEAPSPSDTKPISPWKSGRSSLRIVKSQLNFFPIREKPKNLPKQNFLLKIFFYWPRLSHHQPKKLD